MALLIAAHMDGVTHLEGPAVGLFEHPGMFSILLGDVALFILCAAASQMTCRIGRKLPSVRPSLTRRYFRIYVAPRMFGRRGRFYPMFVALVFFGAAMLTWQSVKLFDAEQYYTHDTFDSSEHLYSFVANRVNLFMSWCVVGPMFFSYLFCHCLAIQQFLGVISKPRRRLATFDRSHPDRSGGYAFFGWMDTLYALGILVAVIEIVLIIVTHRTMTAGSVLAIFAVGVGGLVLSSLSIFQVWRFVRGQGKLFRQASYLHYARGPVPMTVDQAVVTYGLQFSPYTATALKLALTLRGFMVAVPAVLRLAPYLAS